MLTAIIADFFLSHPTPLGITYPAIAMFGDAENFVFTPEFAEGHLELESVDWCLVTESKAFKYQLLVLERASKFMDNKINWEPVSCIKEYIHNINHQ